MYWGGAGRPVLGESWQGEGVREGRWAWWQVRGKAGPRPRPWESPIPELRPLPGQTRAILAPG